MFKFDNMTCWDMVFAKLAIASLVVVVLKVWPAAMTWVFNTSVWWFVLAFIVFAVRAGANCKGCKISKTVKKKVIRRKKKKK